MTSIEHYQRGVIYFENDKIELSLEEFNTAIKLDVYYTQAYYSRGYVHYSLKNMDKAIVDFNKVIELDPNYGSAYFMKGCALDEKKKYIEAIEEYNNAISLKPNDADYYINRGLSNYHVLNFNEAISDWKRAISIDPNLSNELTTLINKAEVASFTAANLMQTFSSKIDTQKSIELCNIGINEKRKGNFDEALKYYDNAKIYDSLNSNIFYNKAKILIGLNRFTEAFRNLLIYYHINMLGTEYKSEVSFTFYEEHLNTKFNLHPSIILGEHIIKNDIRSICNEIPEIKYLIIDLNLSFYAGVCYIWENKEFTIFNEIETKYIENIQKGLLGKMHEYNNALRDIKIDRLIYLIGFLYLFINTNLEIDLRMNVEQFYFNNEFTPNKNFKDVQIYFSELLAKSDDADEQDLPF